MNSLNQNPNEDALSPLLRESRPQPALPPRFRENVWRRIEQAEARPQAQTWLEALASLMLKPRFTIATVTVVLLAGTLLGSMNGKAQARLVAQERYVASVAMNVAP